MVKGIGVINLRSYVLLVWGLVYLLFTINISCKSDKENIKQSDLDDKDKPIIIRDFEDSENLFLDLYEGMNDVEVENTLKELVLGGKLKIVTRNPGLPNQTNMTVAKPKEISSLFEKSQWMANVVYEVSTDKTTIYGTIRTKFIQNQLKSVVLIFPSPIDKFYDLENNELHLPDYYLSTEGEEYRFSKYDNLRKDFLSYIIPLYKEKYGGPEVKKIREIQNITYKYPIINYIFKNDKKTVITSSSIFSTPFINIEYLSNSYYADLANQEQEKEKQKNIELENKMKQQSNQL